MGKPLVYASGSRPDHCPAGHPWTGKGRTLRGWHPCDCANAQQQRPMGHQWIRCRGDGDRCSFEWRDPACSHLQKASGRPEDGGASGRP